MITNVLFHVVITDFSVSVMYCVWVMVFNSTFNNISQNSVNIVAVSIIGEGNWINWRKPQTYGNSYKTINYTDLVQLQG
jgi:hypothetical protein